MKKFYKNVSAKQDAESGQIHIFLDDKPMLTPLRDKLNAGTDAIARAVIEEWESQGEDIDPHSMSITQILTTAQDYVSKNRSEIEDLLTRYLDSDLLCYQTDEPAELAKHQEVHWSPWIGWYKDKMGIVLDVQKTLCVSPLGETCKAKFSTYMSGLDLYLFTVFQMVTSLSGSVVLATAFMERELEPEALFKLIRLEELFYVELHDLAKHGEDPAQEKKDKDLRKDLIGAKKFLDLYYDEN